MIRLILGGLVALLALAGLGAALMAKLALDAARISEIDRKERGW